jgi:hypothetical protein
MKRGFMLLTAILLVVIGFSLVNIREGMKNKKDNKDTKKGKDKCEKHVTIIYEPKVNEIIEILKETNVIHLLKGNKNGGEERKVAKRSHGGDDENPLYRIAKESSVPSVSSNRKMRGKHSMKPFPGNTAADAKPYDSLMNW